MVHLVRMVVQERMVHLVRMVVQERMVHLVRMVVQERMVHLVRMVVQERMVHLVRMVVQERMVHLVRMVVQERMVHLVVQERMVPLRVIGVDLQVGTAGTTNSTTIDINKNGATMFTVKPTLATTVASSPLPFTADNGTTLA